MRTMVIGPHADDEVLGCGGTLLRRAAEGVILGWVLVTEMSESSGGRQRSAERDAEIDLVRRGLGVAPEHQWRLGLPAAALDRVPMADLVSGIASALSEFAPQEVLIPHGGDAHSDHQLVFQAAVSATKWFRNHHVQRVLAYETPSETGFGGAQARAFRPSLHVDIAPWQDRKIELLAAYSSELGPFPFPRSEAAVRALAAHRGAEAGFRAAEAFEVVRWRSPQDVLA